MNNQEMIAKSRAESCLDKSVPLAYPPPQDWRLIEHGVPIGCYYAEKHSNFQFGTYWPLHRTAAREK